MACQICGDAARGVCDVCKETMHDMESLLDDDADKRFRLSFGVSVNLATMERADRRMAGAMRKSSQDFAIELVKTPLRAVLRLNGRLNNGTLLFRRVYLVVTPRALVAGDLLMARRLGLWKECSTEQQCASVMLYNDIFMQLFHLSDLGITMNATDEIVFEETTRFFTSLMQRPVADCARTCGVCGAAARHKCDACRKVYYCSKACQTLAFPVHKRLHHEAVFRPT